MFKLLRLTLSCFLFLLISLYGRTQIVYHDLEKNSVYEFLDELANLQLIDLNTIKKPYSRKLIAEKLSSIVRTSLNKRQLKELDFYLKDFNKELIEDKDFDKRYDLFYFKDSLFSISVNPIIGGNISTNQNGKDWTRYSGGEFFGYAGKNIGFYANLRDHISNEISQNEIFLNNSQGEVFKGNGDYSEIKGGINYSWKNGSVGIVKDRFIYGNNNFGSNIFSDKAPSFTRFELNYQPSSWLDFNYYHGFLTSEVRDSSRSYFAGSRNRIVNVKKYIASNIFTITPFDRFKFSFGNSIVYSDDFQPAFLIPFFFFKTIDHSIYNGGGNNGGANTQVFFDISSRNVYGLHLYTSIFIDEISLARFWNKDNHSNFVSLKFGVQKSNLFNRNITLTAEYTRTNPITFQHFVNTTTYESNQYNFGHYLRDNSQELALGVQYKPIARLKITANFILAEKGEEYEYTGFGHSVLGLPFIEQVKWESSLMQFNMDYELINDVLIFTHIQQSEVSGSDLVQYTYEYFHGTTTTVSLGIRIGF